MYLSQSQGKGNKGSAQFKICEVGCKSSFLTQFKKTENQTEAVLYFYWMREHAHQKSQDAFMRSFN
jgi:hypothetical protein